MLITSSAPGKLILFGEHASSRGYPAIVFAVNKRITTTLNPLEKNDQKKILLTSPIMDVYKEEFPSKKLDVVSKTIEFFLEKTGVKIEPIEINFSSELLSGFGSSAAAIASTLGVLDSYYETNFSKYELLKMGIKANHAVKGYGSGLDIASSIYGGIIKYQIGFEPSKITTEKLDLVIGNTKIKAPSGPIVKAVKEFEKKNPILVKEIFDNIEDIVFEAEKALKNNDMKNLGSLMNNNQLFLQQLGVSSAILDKLTSVAKEAGALGAKLSGAGKGDNMLALVTTNKRKAVIEAIMQAKGDVLEDIKVEENGLIIKKEK